MRSGFLGIVFVVVASLGAFATSEVSAEPATNATYNLVYSKPAGTELLMDIAKPSGKGKYPAVLMIHGGSWRKGSKANFRPFLKRLAAEGFVVAAINYRLAPKFQWPAQIVDCRAAVRYLRKNADTLQIDPTRIGAVGFSAGAHLALLLGSMDEDRAADEGAEKQVSSRVQAVVNFFGPVDIRQFSGRTIEDFMGGKQQEKSDEYHEASPIVHLDKTDAPVLTLHGTKDFLVPFKQAEELNKKLTELKIPHKFVPMKNAGHGWGGKKLLDSLKLTKQFLTRYLKVKAKLY